MRVLYGHQIYCRQRYGGISRYFQEIARRIAAMHDCDAEVIAPLYTNEYLAPAGDLHVRGLKVPSLPLTARTLRLANAALARFANRSRRGVDLYHETYYEIADAAPPGARRVLTVYDMIHERVPESFGRNDRTTREKAFAVSRADHVICISENTRRDLVELFGVDERKTSVIHLGHALPAPVDPTRCVPGLDRPFLLYVGARGGYKNFSGFVHAVAELRRLRRHVAIVCFGGGPLTAAETDLLERLGLAGDVFALSGSDGLLAGLYAEALALVYPSTYEGFGIPPLEAMSLDCPVVCSNSSSLPEVVGDAAAFFSPDQPASLKDAIERVMEPGPFRQGLIERGRHRASLFSWDRCARETHDVYQRILGGAAT